MSLQGAYSILLEFSENGKFLAVLINETKFSLYDVKDVYPRDLIAKMSERKDADKIFPNSYKKMKFLSNSESIAFWSELDLCIYEQAEDEYLKYRLDPLVSDEHSEILDVSMDSKGSYQMILKRRNKNQLDLVSLDDMIY